MRNINNLWYESTWKWKVIQWYSGIATVSFLLCPIYLSMGMGKMLAILIVLSNKHSGLLCRDLQGAKHPGTAHQSEETDILIAEDE